jgi:peptidoglycan/xylan/chitin deacetylase (PgdA/CDA1 family)
MRRRALCALALAALIVSPAIGVAQQPAAPSPPPPPLPLLVTVDDLPVAGAAAQGDAAARMATTNALLAVLKKHGIHAVAFVIAGNVKSDDDRAILQRWLDEGHEIGSHTNTHPSFTTHTIEDYLADVAAAHTTLTAFLQPRGRTLRWFRYPFLREGDTRQKLEAVRGWLSEHGQRAVPVTLDVQDWSFDRPWARAIEWGDAAARELVRQDYLAAIRTTVTESEKRAHAVLKRPAPQVLLLHANGVGAANWDAAFTWLEREHRFAGADEVMADETFRELPADVARYGYGHYDRLARLQRFDAARAGVAHVLEIQADAWNRGDFDTFCSVYAEDATYVSPAGLTRGRDAVLARYRTRYPDAAARGTLSFEIVEVRPADGLEPDPYGGIAPGGVHSVSLVATWRLTYPGKPEASGLTLLVLRPVGPYSWEIVQDASM